jgi:hypothetical protein
MSEIIRGAGYTLTKLGKVPCLGPVPTAPPWTQNAAFAIQINFDSGLTVTLQVPPNYSDADCFSVCTSFANHKCGNT